MATVCCICTSVLSVLYAEAVHKLFGSFFSHLISVSVFCARAHLETLATIMVLSMGSCTYGRAAQNRVIIINCVCALVHTFQDKWFECEWKSVRASERTKFVLSYLMRVQQKQQQQLRQQQQSAITRKCVSFIRIRANDTRFQLECHLSTDRINIFSLFISYCAFCLSLL